MKVNVLPMTRNALLRASIESTLRAEGASHADHVQHATQRAKLGVVRSFSPQNASQNCAYIASALCLTTAWSRAHSLANPEADKMPQDITKSLLLLLALFQAFHLVRTRNSPPIWRKQPRSWVYPSIAAFVLRCRQQRLCSRGTAPSSGQASLEAWRTAQDVPRGSAAGATAAPATRQPAGSWGKMAAALRRRLPTAASRPSWWTFCCTLLPPPLRSPPPGWHLAWCCSRRGRSRPAARVADAPSR